MGPAVGGGGVPPNAPLEAALLAHLAGRGVAVSALGDGSKAALARLFEAFAVQAATLLGAEAATVAAGVPVPAGEAGVDGSLVPPVVAGERRAVEEVDGEDDGAGSIDAKGDVHVVHVHVQHRDPNQILVQLHSFGEDLAPHFQNSPCLPWAEGRV